MVVFQGPKAILSSAIAGALDEYFVVDASKIESNLLTDAKIVLRHVELREQASHIPLNSAGKSTQITLNGHVEEVAFSWAWSVGDAAWVTDAVLTISGAKFEARLEHVDRIEEEEAPVVVDTPADEGTIDRREAFVNPSTIDNDSAREIQQKGGVSGFIERQVKMIIDSLTMKLVDFELRIVLPQQAPASADASDPGDMGVDSTHACNKVIAVGVSKIEILSYGRQSLDGDADGPLKLRQRINLDSFACGIHLEGREGGDPIVSYPFIDPFSYCVVYNRMGERFGGFLSGLEVTGIGRPKDASNDLASITGSGFKIHIGGSQIDAFMRLSVLMLAPPQTVDEQSESLDVASSNHATTSEHGSDAPGADEPSSFHFPLYSISVVYFDDTRLTISAIDLRYVADGTVCSADFGRMEYTSGAGHASATQLRITVRPTLKMTIGCIEEVHVPEVLLLSSPIRSSEFFWEGNTLAVKMDAVDVVIFSSKKEEGAEAGGGASITAPPLPCNVELFIHNGMQIKKADDGSLSKFGRLRLYAVKGDGFSKVAFQCESFHNYLLSVSTVSCCGSFPLDQVNTVNDFLFAAGDITVKSGHSTDEWISAFRPRKQTELAKEAQTTVKETTKELAKEASKKASRATKRASKHEKQKSGIKMPFANISDLKVTISVETSHNLGKVNDTTLAIKAYDGKAETTSNELVTYYTRACLSRAPDFISNAEVLGLNIVDSTAGMLSTWAGIGTLGSTFGAGGGVAAIAAVDAVKGTIDAGKRGRNASEGEQFHPGDLFRGLVQLAIETTQEGAAMRGKRGEGNVLDWTVGATANTTEYVVENKNRLGAAGAGGGGFLLGMALGGPVGAVIGGLVATAATGATLDAIDAEMDKRRIECAEETDETETALVVKQE
ncbi:hypothetical protein ACHAXT_005285 [Thalassiosira profunda]